MVDHLNSFSSSVTYVFKILDLRYTVMLHKRQSIKKKTEDLLKIYNYSTLQYIQDKNTAVNDFDGIIFDYFIFACIEQICYVSILNCSIQDLHHVATFSFMCQLGGIPTL